MTKPDCGVDQKLAADLKSQVIRQLRDYSSPRLQTACESHDRPIREAWEAIQTQMELFNNRKDVIFATLRDVGGEENAREAIRSGLDDMVPPTYRKIMDAMRSGDKRRGGLPTPVTSPGTGNTLNVNPITPAAAAGPSNAMPKPSDPSSPTPAGPVERRPAEASPKTPLGPKILYAKRTRPQSEHAARSAKKSKGSGPEQTQTKNGAIDSWEVEGTEYVFQYPPFGPGWFVLRCDLGPHSKPHTFTSHPFQAESALEHYNNCKTCKGHDTTRAYEPNDIVMSYGYRVRGDNVDHEWVAAANSRLEVENAKTTTGGKGRVRRLPDMGSANRSNTSTSPSSAQSGSLF